MKNSIQQDVEQPKQSGRTLADWKKPLLVTFGFLAFITTGFVGYTYVYFDRIHQQQRANALELKLESSEQVTPALDTTPIEESSESPEAKPCEDYYFRSWETFNISEIELIYRLHPNETFLYLNRPEGPEFIANDYVCDELKPFAKDLFDRILEELAPTYGFDRAKELLVRSNQSDNPWTWSELDSRRYFVKLKSSVLSYVISDSGTSDSNSEESSEEKWSDIRSIQFECPVKVADDLKGIEIGWMTAKRTIPLGRDADNLLEFSEVFRSINVWRTLMNDCITESIKSDENLGILCTDKKCQWNWSQEGLVGFKIRYESGQWSLSYRNQNIQQNGINSNES